MTATEYDAVVYDLDGTLVRLDVDWGAVEREMVAHLTDAGVEATYDETPWELLDLAESVGRYDDLHGIIAAHERDGARTSERLPLADDLADCERPVGVVSLNAEDACRIALEQHGLAEYVDVVVGRDSVATRKPHPEPLLAAVRGLEASPERTLFVGDSPSDETTADRAGTGFRYA